MNVTALLELIDNSPALTVTDRGMNWYTVENVDLGKEFSLAWGRGNYCYSRLLDASYADAFLRAYTDDLEIWDVTENKLYGWFPADDAMALMVDGFDNDHSHTVAIAQQIRK